VGLSSCPAFAFTSNGAAAYAEQNWNKRSLTLPYFADDCTAFVSEALRYGGGYSYRPSTSATDDNYWWLSGNSKLGFHNSRSFSIVPDLYNFLLGTFPGGIPEGTSSGNTTNPWTPAPMVSGDVLFYDWDSIGLLDHAAIQVGIGTDPSSGYYGNVIDQHTSDRYHAIWTLMPYNSKRASTKIRFMHIDPANT
jgi:hypothetical protein